jgi:hypothetical protein
MEKMGHRTSLLKAEGYPDIGSYKVTYKINEYSMEDRFEELQLEKRRLEIENNKFLESLLTARYAFHEIESMCRSLRLYIINLYPKKTTRKGG